MSTISAEATHSTNNTALAGHSPGPEARRASALGPAERIPFTRLVRVEFLKTFNTRAGQWLMGSIVGLAVIASAAVIAFGNESTVTYPDMSAAIGIPLMLLLPVIAILSVTQEYGQRTALTSYTLVPSRTRVIAAKAVTIALIGIASMSIAMAVAALGTLAGAAIRGVDPTWDTSASEIWTPVLANLITMAVGFALAVAFRSSPGAIVAYVVYAFLVTSLLSTLAYYQEWFADIWLHVDLFWNTTVLSEGLPDADGWAQLGTSALLWIGVPLAWGMWRLNRVEVK